MRAAKRLREIMHGIRNKGAPHGWIREDLWARGLHHVRGHQREDGGGAGANTHPE
ncbi:hypothetical protein PIB30_113322 [Stylosanthes scabra]|uniref:Uncharacterized protein n=1 Tax=Stylosanthes scabra TaxID=79078 RepID=A0ABU6UZT4_9FABA|nr:hypothetical protein [Stylosanthes scabra]